MRTFALVVAALSSVACEDDSSPGGTPSPDGGVVITPPDGGTPPPPSDGGGDDGGGGQLTSCGLALGKGGFHWATVASGFMKIHVDGEVDELVETKLKTSDGSSLSPQAILVDNNSFAVMRFGNWYLGHVWPPMGESLTVALAVPDPAGAAPAGGGNYPIAYNLTEGGTIVRVELLSQDFRIKANGTLPGDSVCKYVDFLKAPGADATVFTVVATCLTAPFNRRFELTGAYDTNGNLVSTSQATGVITEGTVGADRIVRMISEISWITENGDLWIAGAKKRPLRRCNGPNVVPIVASSLAVVR